MIHRRLRRLNPWAYRVVVLPDFHAHGAGPKLKRYDVPNWWLWRLDALIFVDRMRARCRRAAGRALRWYRLLRALLTIQRFNGGFWLVGALCWVADYDPRTRRVTIRNRPWPWARFGLGAARMKCWHFRLPVAVRR